MIIQTPSQDTADAKRREAEREAAGACHEATLGADDLPRDPPPMYTQSSSPAPNAIGGNGGGSNPPGPSSSLYASQLPIQPPMQPHNFVTLSRDNGSVKGHWFLDPSLSVPFSLLPPLLADETEESRRNFNVVGKNGSVDIDLTLASVRTTGSGEEKMEDVLGRKRIGIYLRASNGGCKIAIHNPPPPLSLIQPPRRLPFKLIIDARNGSVTIHIPRTFHGLLTFINHNGSLKLSPSLSSSVYTFSEMNKTRKCFIGDYSALHETGVEGWEGDEVYVDAKNGGTKVSWDDEVEERKEKGGFFSRLLGMHHAGHHHHHPHHHHHHPHHPHPQAMMFGGPRGVGRGVGIGRGIGRGGWGRGHPGFMGDEQPRWPGHTERRDSWPVVGAGRW